ncbi:MAG TPA: hypothetical protein VLW84_08155 [Terriglobales bacterium]|nr:hypothetical protein [Terriglobales bacterium]
MILLVTPFVKAQQCAEVIEEATHEEAQVAGSLRQALTSLRAQDYSAVVLDQMLLESEPDESEVLLEHIGMAIPVQVNFAISKAERVVRELRAALQRRKKEVTLARQGAEQALRNELKGPVTALLLSCEMALQVPNLQDDAEIKMRAVYELAREVCNKLEPA